MRRINLDYDQLYMEQIVRASSLSDDEVKRILDRGIDGVCVTDNPMYFSKCLEIKYKDGTAERINIKNIF